MIPSCMDAGRVVTHYVSHFTTYSHVAPLGLGVIGRSSGYKHAAPLGLKDSLSYLTASH